MRFIIAFTATLAWAPILLVSATCSQPTCTDASYTIETRINLSFPSDITSVDPSEDGDSALLAHFQVKSTAVPSCSDPEAEVLVQAEITSAYENQDMLRISLINNDCFEPVQYKMTEIHTAGLIAQLDPPEGSSAPYCLARYDTDTETFTCIQPCSSDSAYSCYIGVDAILGLYPLATEDQQECNANPNLPTAAAAPVPNIHTLSFSAQNQLEIATRHRQYFSRQAPQITVGSTCTPAAGWDLSGSVVNSNSTQYPVCNQDWIATYDWEDLSTSNCYESTSAVSQDDNHYLRYRYKVTMTEVDELYIRPLDQTNLAVYRTTTTVQPFSVLVQQTANASVVFRAFDYSNVVSIVTSATLNMAGTDGRLNVTVFSTVQSQFKFLNVGDGTAMELAKSASEAWEVTNTKSDTGGDADISLNFQVEAAASCSLEAGAFHFKVKVQCADGIDPSNCPIPENGEETIQITIAIPEMDVCESSMGTDLTAELYVYGSATYEDRQAFFTENRTQDFVYVLAVLDSTQISIDGCDVIAATAQLDLQGQDPVNLITDPHVSWDNVHPEMTSPGEYPSVDIGFTVSSGSCLIMYKFSPSADAFPVPYDQDLAVNITFTLEATLPTKKRQLNTASASASFKLLGPSALNDNGDESSSATSITTASPIIASLCMIVMALLF